MTTIEQFRTTLAVAAPPAGLGAALEAMWWLGREDWTRAHETVQAHEGKRDCDWVHAHLHRVEGDLANAAYWYRAARQPVASGDLKSEWAEIAAALLKGPLT
ncbi:MAG: hypothetical protein FJX02_12905 [Alphaproteobacteria bacterium]|nr:hypothetical protein [Alphaproteobacteria bacterium]